MGHRGAGPGRMQAPGWGGHLSPLRALDLCGWLRLAPRSLEAAARVSAQLHMTIDRIKCDGHGLCAELLPELIRLDDWGYPIIAAGPIPVNLAPRAQRAAETSTELALA